MEHVEVPSGMHAEQLAAPMEAYLNENSNLSPFTIEGYRGVLRQFQGFLMSRNHSNAIPNKDEIIDYVTALRERELSPRSIARICVVLRRYCEHLWTEEMLSDKEWKMIRSFTKRQRDPIGEDKRTAYTDEEVVTIMRSLFNPLHKMIFWMGLNFGLRRQELVKLKVTDIDFETGILRVFRSKGLKTRSVFILSEQVPVMQKWLRIRQLDSPSHEYFFYDTKLRPLKLSSLQAIYKDITRTTGIHAYSHKARYTYAVRLWKKNVDILVISKILGHSNVDVTMRYLRVPEDELRAKYLAKAEGAFEWSF
jgi:integrase/recombinase XerD